ncbi:uncharacterized protein V6R79_007771 [Siganus canaliculatus]
MCGAFFLLICALRKEAQQLPPSDGLCDKLEAGIDPAVASTQAAKHQLLEEYTHVEVGSLHLDAQHSSIFGVDLADPFKPDSEFMTTQEEYAVRSSIVQNITS